jgi:DNA-binding transcriptional MerR regulator
MSEEQIILNKTDKANSWETGATGNRWKFYFNDVIDLLEQIKKLKEAGFEIENAPN